MGLRRSTLPPSARIMLILGGVGLLFMMVMVAMAVTYQGEAPGPSPLGMMIFTLLIGVPSLVLFLVGILLALVALVRRKPGAKADTPPDSLQ